MIKRKNAEAYCSEDISKIENYEQAVNDKTQTWHCHHRLEIQGQFRNSPAMLKKCGLYYHVPAWQLIFLTKADHKRIHGYGNSFHTGHHCSSDTKKKLRDFQVGEKSKFFKVFWWTNNITDVRSKTCPGQGWVRGRTKTSKKTK